MRVVSLVPSWTETLMECGVTLVGRSRFCIHPSPAVKALPVVGGTKDFKLELLRELKPDFLVLDKEENTLEMAKQSPCPLVVTHVENVAGLADQVRILANAFQAGQEKGKLWELAKQWQKISKTKKENWSWNQDWSLIPGIQSIVRRDFPTYQSIVYVIWKDPWMSVSPQTFIGSVLSCLGAEEFLSFKDSLKYPTFHLHDFDLEKTFFLFSTEPFPFGKKIQDLQKLGVQGAIVDGEKFSWYGVRSLKFLSTCFDTHPKFHQKP